MLQNHLTLLQVQVAGAPNHITREMPVAVVKLSGTAAQFPVKTVRSLQEAAIRGLGPSLAP